MTTTDRPDEYGASVHDTPGTNAPGSDRHADPAPSHRMTAVRVSVGVLGALGLWWYLRSAGIDAPAIARGLALVADSPFGLGVTVLVFVVASFVGVPQVALMAASAAAFGPGRGFAYSYVAQLSSEAVGHELGRRVGRAAFERRAGPRLRKWGERLARHGFGTCALVRVVPAGPFLLVNGFAGAVGVSRSAFLGGTALGSFPKIATVSFGTAGLIAWLSSGDPAWAALALAAGVGLVALGAWGRRYAASVTPNSRSGA